MKIKNPLAWLRNTAATILTLLALAALVVSPASAASQGPFDAGSGQSISTGGGSIAWANPGNITTAGSPYATASNVPTGSGFTHLLRGANYGFNIPSGSTINTLTVVINRQSTSGLSGINLRDSVVRLYSSAGVGTNRAVTGTNWPTSMGAQTYTGSPTYWGIGAWTIAQINASTFGVELAAVNPNTLPTASRTGEVDYMRITIDYTLPGTTTSVDCGAGTPVVAYGEPISCVATVTRSAGSNTPTGTVSWTTDSSGTIATSPCTLSGSGGTATCSVTYTPTAVGDGTHLITAAYGGDANFTGSAGNQTVTVNKANPTLSVTNSPATYTGAQQAAVVSGSPTGTVSNVQYDGSATEPTNAGTYAVTADFVPDDTANYNSLTGASAGNFVINKADPTLSVTNSPATYTGAQQAAAVDGSVPGVASNLLYDGSATEPTNVGTYAVTADFVPTDTTNYNSLTGASAGDFEIEKADPTLSVTNSPATYNGAQQAAVVDSSTPGVVSNVLYDGSATEPTNAGTYAVTADFVPTDTANYNSLTGASAGDFEIEKADPVLSVTNSPVTYNGAQQAAVVDSSTPGVASNVQYDGSATEPTDAGTYAVTADFVPVDTANYNSLTNEDAGDFEIEKATPTLSVTNSPATYTGAQQAAVVDGSTPGVASNLQYDGSATEPTNVGTYAVTADFVPTDTTNYNSLTGASAGNFVINKADPTLSVTNSPVTYNGAQQAAVVSGSTPGVASNVLYDGSATEPTNAGTYAVTADFVPTDTANYNSLTGAAAGNFVIEKADPTLSVTNSPVTYNGAQQAAVVDSSTPGVASNVQYDGSATEPTDAGTYAVTADFAPTDAANYNSLTGASAGNFVIEKATPTLSVTNSPVTYNGSAQAAVVGSSTTGVASNVLYDGSGTAPTNAGTYAVTADFAPADATNYNSLSGASAGNFVINKATPTLSVTNSPVIYNGSPQAAAVDSSTTGTVSNVLYDGSGTVPTDPGTYAITADFAPADATNYNSLSGASAGNFVIQPAGPYLTLVKTADPTTFNWVGDVIAYSYLLTNTGDVTLDGPFTVTDDLATVTCPATTSLAPTESITCTASYTITLDDVIAGVVTNSATGSGFFLTNPVVSDVAQATVTGVSRKLHLPIIYR